MTYRVYNAKNTPCLFPTYFRTKREAVAFAQTVENAVIERKIGGQWFAY